MTREKGKIIQWNDSKGFGFILPENSNKHIFVHIKSFTDRRIRPSLKEEVTYTVSKKKDGKYSAIDVARASDTPQNIQKKNQKKKKNLSLKSISTKHSNYKIDSKPTHSINIFYIIFILSFLSFLLFSFTEGKLPFFIIIIYGVMSIVTYFMYSIDKSKAINDEYRIPELTLYFLSLIGGWMGAMLAQQRFRHKTKKSSFQMIFWITVLLNVSVLIHEFKLL